MENALIRIVISMDQEKEIKGVFLVGAHTKTCNAPMAVFENLQDAKEYEKEILQANFSCGTSAINPTYILEIPYSFRKK